VRRVQSYQDGPGAGRDPCGGTRGSGVYLEDDRYQVSAVAALEPIYRGGTRGRAVAAGSAHPSWARETDVAGSGGPASAYRRPGRRKPTAAERALSGLCRGGSPLVPSRLRRARLWRALADGMGSGGSWWRCTARPGPSHKLASGLEREILLVIAVAYDEKLDQSDKAVEYFPPGAGDSRGPRRNGFPLSKGPFGTRELYPRTPTGKRLGSDLVDFTS